MKRSFIKGFPIKFYSLTPVEVKIISSDSILLNSNSLSVCYTIESCLNSLSLLYWLVKYCFETLAGNVLYLDTLSAKRTNHFLARLERTIFLINNLSTVGGKPPSSEKRFVTKLIRVAFEGRYLAKSYDKSTKITVTFFLEMPPVLSWGVAIAKYIFPC